MITFTSRFSLQLFTSFNIIAGATRKVFSLVLRLLKLLRHSHFYSPLKVAKQMAYLNGKPFDPYESIREMSTNALYDYYGKHDHTPTIPNIEVFYETHRQQILDFGKERPLTYYWAYAFDWTKIFTPIEFDAWQIIRSLGYVVLYPQYPVMSYRPDFANPNLKIILECDGKDYHDKKKDTIRDERLLRAGWKVFRVTGSELYKTDEIEYDINGELDYESLENHYMNTAEGVIKSIRSIYFTKEPYDPDPGVSSLMYKTLEKHRLVEFPITIIGYE